MEKKDQIDAIKTISLLETENISKRSRFGLFTKPPPLCMHDPYRDEPHKFRGHSSSKELNKNVSTNKPKQGKNEDIYFSVPSYVTIGDTYQDPFKLKKFNYHNGTMARPQTITAWRPSDVKKNSQGMPYPYMEDPTKSDAALPIFKVPTEKEKETSKQRFTSSVGKRGRNFNRFTPYYTNPYDIPRDKERGEKAQQRNRCLNGPFLTSDKHARPFTTNTELYDKRNFQEGMPGYIQTDLDTINGGLQRKTQSVWRPNNPSKKGFNSGLNKMEYSHYGRYYKEKPQKQLVEEKIWIPNSNGIGSVPNSSIVANARNGNFANKTMGNWNRGK